MKYNHPIMIYAIAILSAAILLSSCGGNTAHRDSASGTEVDGSWIENPQRSLCCYYENQYDKLAQYDLEGNLVAEFEDSLELAEVDGNRIDSILVDDTHLYYSGQSEKDKRKYQIFSVPITEKDGVDELHFSEKEKIYEMDGTFSGRLIHITDEYIVWEDDDDILNRVDRNTEEIRTLDTADYFSSRKILDGHILFLEKIEEGIYDRLDMNDWSLEKLEYPGSDDVGDSMISSHSLPRIEEKKFYYVTPANDVICYDAAVDRAEKIITGEQFDQAVSEHPLPGSENGGTSVKRHAWGVMYPLGDKMLIEVRTSWKCPSLLDMRTGTVEYEGFQIFSFDTAHPDRLQYEAERSEALSLPKAELEAWERDGGDFVLRTYVPWIILPEKMMIQSGLSQTPQDLETYAYDVESGKITELDIDSKDGARELIWFSIRDDSKVF